MFSAFRSRLGATGSGKRFSVSFGHGVEKSQRGRGYVAGRWFQRTLLGGLGRSWRTFCLIFSLSFFYFEFLSILSRFRRGFGSVLGEPMAKKLRFLVFFGICIWKPYFSWIFAWSLLKTMAKNIWNFHCFWICCCIICLLNLLFSVMLETLKIVISPRENTYFYKISFFAFDVQRCRKLV